MKARDSTFIEAVVHRWCSKLGRARLARALFNMCTSLSHDKRQRSATDFQKCYDYIEVDENNIFRVTSKIVKAFFYFVGENLDVFSENDLDYRINGKYHPATRVSASKQVHSTIPFQQVNEMWYDRQERVKVRKNISC